MRKQFCKNGHDTYVYGRTSSNLCKECSRVNRRIDPTKDSRLKQICAHGHDTSICGRDSRNACNDCKKDWFKENPDYLKEYYAENKSILDQKNREYFEKHKDEMLAKMKEWRDSHKEQKAIIDKEWHKNNPWSNIKNETNRNLRVVAWTDWDNVKKVYKNKPTNMTVDHYIPLQGDDVAGLHISYNLQYLSKSENSSKGNKINLLEASEWYGNILKEAGLK